MRAFGEQVTLALSTARSATTDGLTGLANHRVFYERLEQELARGRRYDAPVSLLMIDIDDFKELNDTYGHPAGDEALRRLGLLLAEQLRRGIDLPARYGGEEFAVILPNTAVESAPSAEDGETNAPAGGAPAPGHREGAEALAERLRSVIAARRLPLADGAEPVSIRVSIGVASYPDMAGNMDDLVARADAALYAAKRAGKDRVEVYWRRRQEPSEVAGTA
jgi:PleD family two-component response regulator